MKKITLLLTLLTISLGYSQTFDGTWKMSPQAGAYGVGPALGLNDYFANSDGDLTTRACYFDDDYVFNSDGTFSNVQGDQTWLEGWQGPDGCGAPVAPHNGANAATWAYDNVAKTLTLTGVGAYIGLPKVYNGGELPTGVPPASITYIVTDISSTLATLDIAIAGSGFWRFIIQKQVLATSSFQNSKVKMFPNPAKNSLTINGQDKIENVSLYTVLGQKVLDKNPKSQNVNLDLSGLQRGVYVVKTTTNGKVATSKIVKE